MSKPIRPQNFQRSIDKNIVLLFLNVNKNGGFGDVSFEIKWVKYLWIAIKIDFTQNLSENKTSNMGIPAKLFSGCINRNVLFRN